MSRSLLCAIAAAGLLLGASACSDAPGDGDCKKLLAHMISLQVKSAPEADQAKHSKSLKDDIGKSFLKRCERNIKASQIACGLKASTLEEFEKCDS